MNLGRFYLRPPRLMKNHEARLISTALIPCHYDSTALLSSALKLRSSLKSCQSDELSGSASREGRLAKRGHACTLLNNNHFNSLLLTLPLSGRQMTWGGTAESKWRPVHSRGGLDSHLRIVGRTDMQLQAQRRNHLQDCCQFRITRRR